LYQGIVVAGLVCEGSAQKVTASNKGSDSEPVLPVRLRGTLCPYSLKHPLLAFDPPIAVCNAFSDRLEGGSIVDTVASNLTFDPISYLARAGVGRRISDIEPKENFFVQGDPADSVFYLQCGQAKLTVVSHQGKEATVTILSSGDFVGEESLAAVPGLRLSTATAINACTALRIEREEMIQVMHQEHALSDMFLKFLLARSMRAQADLVDQLFNSSEKRLARILLLMAEFGKPGEPESFIPPITQETLADLIGTTRSRVSFFMNRFRKLGFIDYNGRIRVHKSLLNVILLDEVSGQDSERPPVFPSSRELPDRPMQASPRLRERVNLNSAP
jgi:CRP/FNR family transcriptional regulator, cyclic AMP receptor protein